MRDMDRRFELTRLPEANELRLLKNALMSPDDSELTMQRLFESHPTLLAPLEFAEFVRELRLDKRDLSDHPAAHRGRQRIPDVAGIRLFPLDTPLVLEMKGPRATILDSSTRTLSDDSREVIAQLRSAVLHIFRPEGVKKFKDVYGWKIADLLPPELIAEIDALPFRQRPNDDEITKLLITIQDAGVSFIALIGQSTEFQMAPDLLLTARAAYRANGVMLFTYDELLVWNELLLDFAQSTVGLHEYFNTRRVIRTVDGSMCKFNERSILRGAAISQLQDLIIRTSENICIYGMGLPPTPAPSGTLKALLYFDISRVLDHPTFLGGREHLLWAGRYQGDWIVVKRRLSEPLCGEVVWYFFDPPVTRLDIRDTMN